MLENQPPSVVLEVDVREIIARYNQRMKKGNIGKERSALKKRDRPAGKVSLDPSKPETIPIGMDREHLQEDLEKVPVKTYETSMARLQNQDNTKDGTSITKMLQVEEPNSPVAQSSPAPLPENPPNLPAASPETQPSPIPLPEIQAKPAPEPEKKLDAIIAPPAKSPAAEPPGK
ncbi:unnamed protein product [Strongylus vulgaris]|uniref:Uncharacterized protein n=1 Tax=Strongylus vulgaris TaxID=40348 RepID=A0A3P7LH12_STRVU|nr:unnamed protein product [Strongylus vulgaris]